MRAGRHDGVESKGRRRKWCSSVPPLSRWPLALPRLLDHTRCDSTRLLLLARSLLRHSLQPLTERETKGQQIWRPLTSGGGDTRKLAWRRALEASRGDGGEDEAGVERDTVGGMAAGVAAR